jgi:integrase
MRGGKPFRQCTCRNPETGKRYGSKCPKLSSRTHGTWWYRFEAPTVSGEKRRQPVVGPFPTKKAAEDSLGGTRDRLARNLAVPLDRTLTVGQYLDSWIAGKVNLKASVRASYEEHVRLYFKPGIGHIRLIELTDQHIEDMYAAMRRLGTTLTPSDTDPISETLRRLSVVRRGRARPLSPSRIRRIHATLRSALNTAVKKKKLTHSPAEHVELPYARNRKPLIWTRQRVEHWRRTGRRPGPVMVWTPEHVADFLDLVETDDLYALWRLIAYRGIRRGEATGLPDYDVDLDNATIDIQEIIAHTAAVLDMSEDDLEDPKSDAGARTLSLDSGTMDALREYRDRRDQQRRALGTAWVDSGRFFTQPSGAALAPAWLSQRFRQLVEQAATRRVRCDATTRDGRRCTRQVPARDGRCHQHGGSKHSPIRDGLPPVRLHDLRHGSATYALAAGIASKVVSEDLGHARVQTTENLYVSVLPELKQAAADAVADTINRARRR